MNSSSHAPFAHTLTLYALAYYPLSSSYARFYAEDTAEDDND